MVMGTLTGRMDLEPIQPELRSKLTLYIPLLVAMTVTGSLSLRVNKALKLGLKMEWVVLRVEWAGVNRP